MNIDDMWPGETWIEHIMRTDRERQRLREERKRWVDETADKLVKLRIRWEKGEIGGSQDGATSEKH